ncbi:hypothetical protein RRG08_034850 [Elysia crispata]|uniref:C-type lectin domain-containing protein n=1 Tax=Elysia crispata TaxID=231223 RepID=A0AAE1E0Z7_9GAST|nr:hypothetical protein RRG08_034850 [Elysia crispata]
MALILLILLIISAVSVASNAIESSCPVGLLNAADSYYIQTWNGSCFNFVLYSKKTYSDANRYCQMHGGTLVLPKTESLNKFLIDKLENYYEYFSDVWIGLHDKKKENTFVWEDHTNLVWSNFAKNNGPGRSWFSGRSVEDCVALDPHDRGRWHDYQCGPGFVSYLTWADYIKSFICQYTLMATGDDVKGDIKKKAEKGNAKVILQDAVTLSRINKNPSTDGGQDKDQTNIKDEDKNPKDDKDADHPLGPTVHLVHEDGCPVFQCDEDCGMRGYQKDQRDCQICKCY